MASNIIGTWQPRWSFHMGRWLAWQEIIKRSSCPGCMVGGQGLYKDDGGLAGGLMLENITWDWLPIILQLIEILIWYFEFEVIIHLTAGPHTLYIFNYRHCIMQASSKIIKFQCIWCPKMAFRKKSPLFLPQGVDEGWLHASMVPPWPKPNVTGGAQRRASAYLERSLLHAVRRDPRASR